MLLLLLLLLPVTSNLELSAYPTSKVLTLELMGNKCPENE
jgi:hypothetical protein